MFTVGALGERLAGRIVDTLTDLRNSRRGRADRKTVYLHIGAHKTGTTAVQTLLRAESRRLKWFGFFYDRRFYRFGKYLARRSPLPDEEREQLRLDVNGWLRARPEANIIGSSEALFGDLFASYANIEAVARDVRAILTDHDVRIVACIRRQDDFIQSVYHQHIKRGGTLRFDAFLRVHDIHAYRWNELLAKYVAVFGRGAVSVFRYEDVFQSPTAILERLFPLSASGFRSKARLTIRNPSLSSKGIEIAVRCNDLLDAKEQTALRRFLQKTFNQRPGEKHTLFTDEQRRELLAFYADSNQECIESFLGDSSRAVAYLPVEKVSLSS